MEWWHKPKTQVCVLLSYVPFFLVAMVGGFKVTELLASRGASTLASAKAAAAVIGFCESVSNLLGNFSPHFVMRKCLI